MPLTLTARARRAIAVAVATAGSAAMLVAFGPQATARDPAAARVLWFAGDVGSLTWN